MNSYVLILILVGGSGDPETTRAKEFSGPHAAEHCSAAALGWLNYWANPKLRVLKNIPLKADAVCLEVQ